VGPKLQQPVRSTAGREQRRSQILAGMQQAMGVLPARTHLPPLNMKVLATELSKRTMPSTE